MERTMSTNNGATSLVDQTLIEAIFKDPYNPELIHYIEVLRDFDKVDEYTLWFIWFNYNKYKKIMNRIPKNYLNGDWWYKILVETFNANDCTQNELLISAMNYMNKDVMLIKLLERIDYYNLDEDAIYEIWGWFRQNKKIMDGLPKKYIKNGWWYKICNKCRLMEKEYCACDMQLKLIEEWMEAINAQKI